MNKCERCEKTFTTKARANIHMKTCTVPPWIDFSKMPGTEEEKYNKMCMIINQQYRYICTQMERGCALEKSVDVLKEAIDAMARSNFLLNTVNIYVKNDKIPRGNINPDSKELLSRILERITS